MIFIERLIILILLCAFISTLVLFIFSLIQNTQARKAASLAIEKALQSNSKKNLEDVLILHNKSLDKDTKEKLQQRIADIVLDEEEVNFQSKDSFHE